VSHEQGADELRMKAILKTRGVGPDAKPAVPPKPTGRPRDWLDDILDTKTAPRPTAPKPKPEPKAAAKPGPAPAGLAGTVEKTGPKPPAGKAKKRRKKRKKPGPDTPRSAFDGREQSPRQSLLDAWGAVPYRLKWLAYHAAAGYLGWAVGLVDWVTYVTNWIATTGLIGPQAFFWYGAAALPRSCCTGAPAARWLPVAWLAAVPATSTVAGVLLYGTPHL
jgi:hypothetical protein